MEEAIIIIGLLFYLLYFANSFENQFLKVTLKLLSTIYAFSAIYVILIPVNLANAAGLYENLVWGFANGMKFFWAIWGVILIKEVLELFEDKKRKKYGGEEE